MINKNQRGSAASKSKAPNAGYHNVAKTVAARAKLPKTGAPENRMDAANNRVV